MINLEETHGRGKRAICVSVQQDALTAGLYVNARDAVGFCHYDREDTRMVLDGGLHSVIAYVDGQVTGISHVADDGHVAFFVKDPMASPRYQGGGVGTVMLHAFITCIREHCCNHAYTGLMVTPNKESFCEKYGFLRRLVSGYGSGLA